MQSTSPNWNLLFCLHFATVQSKLFCILSLWLDYMLKVRSATGQLVISFTQYLFPLPHDLIEQDIHPYSAYVAWVFANRATAFSFFTFPSFSLFYSFSFLFPPLSPWWCWRTLAGHQLVSHSIDVSCCPWRFSAAGSCCSFSELCFFFHNHNVCTERQAAQQMIKLNRPQQTLLDSVWTCKYREPKALPYWFEAPQMYNPFKSGESFGTRSMFPLDWVVKLFLVHV